MFPRFTAVLYLFNIVCAPVNLAGTELDDVKKLLKGRSSSVSPTRSSNASITVPVPSKATVETQTISVAAHSGMPLPEGAHSLHAQTPCLLL